MDADEDINVIISNEGNLIISQVRFNDAGNYTCVAQNVASRRLSEPAQLNVYGMIPRLSSQSSVASIHFLGEGAKFYPSRVGGRSFGPKGVGFFGCPSPPARRCRERCMLPQRVSGRSPGNFGIWCNLRPQKSLQKCLIMCNL